jgi:hypothetical protein
MNKNGRNELENNNIYLNKTGINNKLRCRSKIMLVVKTVTVSTTAGAGEASPVVKGNRMTLCALRTVTLK